MQKCSIYLVVLTVIVQNVLMEENVTKKDPDHLVITTEVIVNSENTNLTTDIDDLTTSSPVEFKDTSTFTPTVTEEVTVPINKSKSTIFSYITRSGWNARKAKLVEFFSEPAKYVIIHHSYKPSHCNSPNDCVQAVHSMQNFHMDDRGWNDIGYSFAVGGDGLVYQGRGFQVIGAHAPGYNARSVGICIIGDWTG